jgi:hypothetical protein
MLDLWRPPQGAGDPIGCLATTYTFAPGLFDEQCLARFLEIGSEPDREDLAFLLERENRLGGVYAGVLVDYTQAGVEHSLRWDVLPVRVPGGKQHAKLSLLAWDCHVRIIVASANLTEPGYRTNREVAAAVDLTPQGADRTILAQAMELLRSLLLLVPGSAPDLPEVRRAAGFLDQVERQTRSWRSVRRGHTIRQQLVFTLPSIGQRAAHGSLEEAILACRARGESPHEAWVASPFFDFEDSFSRVTADLCRRMTRRRTRELYFCVPAIGADTSKAVPRLAAPKALLLTPPRYGGVVSIEILPEVEDKNQRPWHAKMVALRASQYIALMIGSSNFTCAGMGLGQHRNAEANLVTIVDKVSYSRDSGDLLALWPKMNEVANPDAAEWLGAQPGLEEEEQAPTPRIPMGFLSATYRAGDERRLVLRLDPENLPEDWRVYACGRDAREVLAAPGWRRRGRPRSIELSWQPVQPPEKLQVEWGEYKAFLPLNVEDNQDLPPPAQLEHMSADDMLWVLAATDPSAAFRAWARRQQPPDLFDPDLDSSTPIDLDPLRRYDLQATFLHRIRRRARVLADLRANLERPVWGRQALEWRLRGMIGVEALANRLVLEFARAGNHADEALLTVADFLIVLREVKYQAGDGAMPRAEFQRTFRPFLRDLAGSLDREVAAHCEGVPKDVLSFWKRVIGRCQE